MQLRAATRFANGLTSTTYRQVRSRTSNGHRGFGGVCDANGGVRVVLEAPPRRAFRRPADMNTQER
jgi:hypothetical protein